MLRYISELLKCVNLFSKSSTVVIVKVYRIILLVYWFGLNIYKCY